jgi:hypothetical protein
MSPPNEWVVRLNGRRTWDGLSSGFLGEVAETGHLQPVAAGSLLLVIAGASFPIFHATRAAIRADLRIQYMFNLYAVA